MGEAVTQLRKFRDSISNWFDEIERGVGKRGSTFTDVDAITHDKDTKRFLFREFKRKGERLDKAQRWVLSDLAGLPGCTVWFVRKEDDDHVGWARFGSGLKEQVITVPEYRIKLAHWWANKSDSSAVIVPLVPQRALTANDISW